MNKIKLERWKEVVRLEVVEGELPDIFNTVFMDDGNISISFWNSSDKAQIEYDGILAKIEQYNNSVKDDGYKWKCKECDNECISRHHVYGHICNFVGEKMKIKANWQKINNNKIEIVED